ncbi:protein phosphatase 2C domain-containing protein, partial [Patescibacteria group bacterium]
IIRSATTAGNHHKSPNNPGAINNQDAVEEIIVDGEVVGAVICDGCGSKPHSEIGSRFGAVTIANFLSEKLNQSIPIDWNDLTGTVAMGIAQKAMDYNRVHEEVEETIRDNFLFTIMIAVIVDGKLLIASCGDGVYRIDDDIYEIESPIENAPTYLAFKLIKSKYDPSEIQIQLNEEIDLNSLSKGVVIGSDGASELIEVNDAIFHPALMGNETAIQTWLQGKVYDVRSLFIGDDISIVRISTDKIQEEMLKDRMEINVFRREIADLNRQFDDERLKSQRLSQLLMSKAAEIKRLKKELKIERRRNTWSLSNIFGQSLPPVSTPATQPHKRGVVTVPNKSTTTVRPVQRKVAPVKPVAVGGDPDASYEKAIVAPKGDTTGQADEKSETPVVTGVIQDHSKK